MTEGKKPKRDRKVKRVTKRRIWLDDNTKVLPGNEVLLDKRQVEWFSKHGALVEDDD